MLRTVSFTSKRYFHVRAPFGKMPLTLVNAYFPQKLAYITVIILAYHIYALSMFHSRLMKLFDQNCECLNFTRFTETFFESPPYRYYGPHVRTVFEKLEKASRFSDLFGPASEQFDGQGSYGNGSAMRVFPVALFCHGNQELLEKVFVNTVF